MPRLSALISRHIRGIGLFLIGVSLVWKVAFISHYYFWQDDFHFIELALGHSMSWSYLTFVGAGHMFPAVYAIIWVFSRASLYNWDVATVITVVMLAVAGLAALRLLRTLFGDTPAILVPLLIYLLCPLTVPEMRWWSAAIEAVPVQAAVFFALNAQVWYARTGRFRHGLAATAWVLVGLAFNEKAAVIPALLVGVTSAFFIEGPWLRSIGQCLRRYWPAWLLQLALLVVYAAVLKEALHTSTVQPGAPSSAGGVLTFVDTLVRDTFLPGAIGGPWDWFPQSSGEWAYANAPSTATVVSLIVAVGVILASIVLRRHAWRAWAILAGWLLVADVVPVVIGRINDLGQNASALLGIETRYVSDAVPVLAVCVGLAFLPVAARPDVRRRTFRLFAEAEGTEIKRIAAATLVVAFVIGSVWSVQAFRSATTSAPDEAYLHNAMAALAAAPPGTVIADTSVPSALMLGTFKQFSKASQVVGPTESTAAKANIRWMSRPDGTIDSLRTFGADGRLHLAAVYGRTSVPLATGQGCQVVSQGQIVIPFAGQPARGSTALHIAYIASAAVNGQAVTVRYGGTAQRLTLVSGVHNAYLPIRGSAASLVVSGSAVTALCIGAVQAGFIVPVPKGPTIPATS